MLLLNLPPDNVTEYLIKNTKTLPKSCEEYLDDVTGKSYYHNIATGMTTWDDPRR
jgi:hypothetical protein